MDINGSSSQPSHNTSSGQVLLCMACLPAVKSYGVTKQVRRSLTTQNGVFYPTQVPHHLMSSAAYGDAMKRMSTSRSLASGPMERNPGGTFYKLRRISNVASILCVLDCTLLPIITVLMPLLGLVSMDAERVEMFHHLGHALALYFVLPVGGLTTIMNYLSHKTKWITALAICGMTMIGLANTHLHVHFHDLDEFLHGIQHDKILHAIDDFLHEIQHDKLWHPLFNVSGCALLLTANYLSQRNGCASLLCNHPQHKLKLRRKMA